MTFKTPKELLFETDFHGSGSPLFKNQIEILKILKKKHPHYQNKASKTTASLLSTGLRGVRSLPKNFIDGLKEVLTEKLDQHEHKEAIREEIIKSFYLQRLMTKENKNFKEYNVSKEDIVAAFNHQKNIPEKKLKSYIRKKDL